MKSKSKILILLLAMLSLILVLSACEIPGIGTLPIPGVTTTAAGTTTATGTTTEGAVFTECPPEHSQVFYAIKEPTCYDFGWAYHGCEFFCNYGLIANLCVLPLHLQQGEYEYGICEVCGGSLACDHVETEVARERVEPTCTEWGREAGVEIRCLHCNLEFEITAIDIAHDGGWIPPLGHSYENGACANCGDIQYGEPCEGEHTLVVVEAAKEPTCTEDGHSEMYRCSVCGVWVPMRLIPALGHNYEYGVCADCGDIQYGVPCEGECTLVVVEAAKEPTCTEYGHSGSYRCSECGVWLATRVFPALGHNYENGVCADCGDILDRDLCEGEHTLEPVYAEKEPTCTEDGYGEIYRCFECGVRVSMRRFEALGHNYENGVCTRCAQPE